MAAKLITEDDVRRRRAGDPIVLDEQTRITPSARDLAHVRGIAIVEAGSAATPSRTAIPVLHLPDGQYLLHVDRGRARVFRLTPNGPIPFDG